MAKHITKYFLTISLFCVTISFAQNKNVTISEFKDSTGNSRQDTLQFQMQKSPWGAVLRSTLLPGLGQFYNGSYWKIPVIWGALGYLGYQWNTCNNLYRQYRDLFTNSLDQQKDGNPSYYRYREFYRDQRDLFAIYIGLTFLLNLVDAYVDAQLFDFDVTNDQMTTRMNLSMRVRF